MPYTFPKVNKHKSIYALVDCNNFFVSCERVFSPNLENVPVVVLSNNDGCVIARSNEVKEIGIRMGEPYFMCKSLIKQHNVRILSSNFKLYADMSARVFAVLASLVPDVEIYSVDEAFIDLTSFQGNFDILRFGQDLAQKIKQYTGIPVSIGIGPTRTLAKCANHVVKKHKVPKSVKVVLSDEEIRCTLKKINVEDVWGVGRKTAAKLHSYAIYRACDLLTLNKQISNANFAKPIKNTLLELKGEDKVEIERERSGNKHTMIVSNTFGNKVHDKKSLKSAIANFVARATFKLREQNQKASGIHVYLHTNRHDKNNDFYALSASKNFIVSTNNTKPVQDVAFDIINEIFISGLSYKRAGIYLWGLHDANLVQEDLFAKNSIETPENKSLMKNIDAINKRHGKGTIYFASEGLCRKWKMSRQNLSKEFTTRWDQLPEVK